MSTDPTDEPLFDATQSEDRLARKPVHIKVVIDPVINSLRPGITEVPIPPKPEAPPESLPELVFRYASSRDFVDKTHVNAAYEWIDAVAHGSPGTDPEAKDGKFRAEVIPRMIGGIQFTLVLFYRPVRFIDDASSFVFRAMAAILREEHRGPGGRTRRVTGWLIDNHDEARVSLDLMEHPEKAEDLPDDCYPYLPEADDEDDE